MQSRHHWLIKKAIRKAVVLGSWSSGAIAVRRLSRGSRVRALTYHQFGTSPRDPWFVTAQSFEGQMRWLAERGLAVSLEAVERFVRGEGELADGSVLVTIDDGFRSVLSVAAPIIQRYRIPAVAYVTTSAMGNQGNGSGEREPFLGWPELVELEAAGITIGSHGHTHRSMAKLPGHEARDEARRSKDLLESTLGKAVTSFAYAYGMRGDESPATARLLEQCGYRSVFTSQHGSIGHDSDRLRLPRIKVEGGEPLWVFKLLCRGGMDAWSLADRLR